MRIVVDSNRVLAAMIKDSTTREILFDLHFEFIAPEFLMSEIEKYKERVMEASDITEEAFEILCELIFGQMTLVPETEYKKVLESVRNDITDPNDVAYIAVGLALRADGIWTHDPHFLEQNKVKVLTNIEMLKLAGKAKME